MNQKDLIQAATNYEGCPTAKELLSNLVANAREEALEYIGLFSQLQLVMEDFKTLLDEVGNQSVGWISPELLSLYERFSNLYDVSSDVHRQTREENGSVRIGQ